MLGKVVFGQLVVLWFLRSLSGIWLISNGRLASGPIKPMRNAQLSCLFWTCMEFAKHYAALDLTRLTRLWEFSLLQMEIWRLKRSIYVGWP